MSHEKWQAVAQQIRTLASELDEIERAYAAGDISSQELAARCEAVFSAIKRLDESLGIQPPED
ncbi:MAG: hypothetical protein AB7E98_19860 [Pirellulales bacterium]